MIEIDFFDHVSGMPCNNCESEPAMDGELCCSEECRAEYEEWDEDGPERDA